MCWLGREDDGATILVTGTGLSWDRLIAYVSLTWKTQLGIYQTKNVLNCFSPETVQLDASRDH